MVKNIIIITLTALVAPIILAVEPIGPDPTKLHDCVVKARNDWGISVTTGHQMDKWCCFQWQAYECQMELGDTLTEDDKQAFTTSQKAIHLQLEADCTNYPANTMLKHIIIMIITALVAPTILAVEPICPDPTKIHECVTKARNDWGISNTTGHQMDKWCCFQWQAYECQMELGAVTEI
ncbi:unnamed protein product [Oppiella nova]|uniref:Uncharacterized protein n=1 Tax=Oppiella nova TaxID=334625 RepID=A0A7R9QEW9_9ACAR|nr:unnamed protein product [Oppiella nova]CAG2164437.1 unnamed protein product [Oppiella nova]